jgi:uncharacterized protein YndB with AHSA1/START domain
MAPGPEHERAAGRTSPTQGPAPLAPDEQVDPIREVVTVRCPPERAFALFTQGMGTWWPVGSYSRAVSEFAHEGVAVTRLEFQPRLGGSILEHLSDGRVASWGEVIAWHPPHDVRMAWRPHSKPEPPTEVAVTFAPLEDGETVVELEHRGWERLSPAFREELYGVYVRGWVTTFQLFAAAANVEDA